jgi:V8-like Glu-specific endopeptidase/subtilisin-like proprotein convertase family protein
MNSLRRAKWPIIWFLLTGCLNIEAVDNRFGQEKGKKKKVVVGKVIYGSDDRQDIEDFPLKQFRILARSTAAQIPRDILKKEGATYHLKSKTLAENGVCYDEKFTDQLAPANCSGFLISEDILVTAGHCMESNEDCRYYHWVFDFKKGKDGKVRKTFSKDDVYSCHEILVSKHDRQGREDYALIRLDRSVLDRRPLLFRKKGKIEDHSPVVVIGHPSGLPTKIAGNAKIRDNTHPVFFNANLDTFTGNSGSAVFNKKTGLVEGILVRGDTDYVTNQSCMTTNRCKNSECRGEDVTRITLLKDIDEIIQINKRKNEKTLEGFLNVFSETVPIELPDKGVFAQRFRLKGNKKIRSIKMKIKVFHPMIDDLKISIIHPSGEEIVLNRRKGFPQLVWERNFKEDEESRGVLFPFIGLRSFGEWILKIEDGVYFDKGQLEYFSFSLN